MTEKCKLTEISKMLRAMEIFRKYDDGAYFYSAYEKLELNLTSDVVSEEDKEMLKQYGWFIDEDEGHFYTFT